MKLFLFTNNSKVLWSPVSKIFLIFQFALDDFPKVIILMLRLRILLSSSLLLTSSIFMTAVPLS